jgi:hypothetical protein
MILGLALAALGVILWYAFGHLASKLPASNGPFEVVPSASATAPASGATA